MRFSIVGQPHYVAAGKDDAEDVYWSNEHGWGSLDAATVFTHDETKDLNLPVGGHWAEVRLLLTEPQ